MVEMLQQPPRAVMKAIFPLCAGKVACAVAPSGSRHKTAISESVTRAISRLMTSPPLLSDPSWAPQRRFDRTRRLVGGQTPQYSRPEYLRAADFLHSMVHASRAPPESRFL